MSWTSAILCGHLTFVFKFILFLRERERQSMSGGGAGREGDTEPEALSRLQAVSTDKGLELTECKIVT